MNIREKLPAPRDLLRYALGAILLTLLLALLHGMVYNGEDVFVLSLAVPALAVAAPFGLGAIHAPWVALALFLAAVCCHLLKRREETIPQFLFRARVPLALLLWIGLTLLEINGSSIYLWHDYLPESDGMQGPLYGMARGIRSDEWGMGTPIAREAYYHGLSNSAYMQAVSESAGWNPLLVFSPADLMFWLLGYNMGRSCFWWFQMLGLALVTIEFLLVLTGGQKRLAAIGAMLIVLSPFAQWWNATAYLLYGQLALVLLHRWLHTESSWQRALLAVGMGWCAGCFAFILYPAWLIPLVYIFGLVAIFLVWRARKTVRVRPRDVVALLAVAGLLLLVVAFFFYHARGAVHSVAGSVYPGQRDSTGGGKGSYFYSYFSGLFLPYRSANLVMNQSENGLFFSFHPVGLLLALWVIFRQRRRDGLLIGLLVMDVCFFLFAAFGFPTFLARLTLLSYSAGIRIGQLSGYLHLLLLLRAVSLMEGPMQRWQAALLGAGCAAVALVLGTRIEQAYFTPIMLALSFLVIGGGAYLFARYPVPRCRWLLSGLVVVVSLVCGATVNPLQRGMARVEQVPLYQAIWDAETETSGLWVMEGDFPLTNFPMMAGAETLNATQRYPDLERWGALDDSEEAREIYNRYAHISVQLVEEPAEDIFELISGDQFRVRMTLEDLLTLGAEYVVTTQDLASWGDETAILTEIAAPAPYRVYRLETR